MLLGTQKINEAGHLEIGGCDAAALVKEHGTPLYVLDEWLIRENCRHYLTAFEKYYDGEFEVAYAGKANLCAALVQLVKEEGMGLDCASGGDVYTALSVDFPAAQIYLHGNNKSENELGYALDSGVGRIVVDSEDELLLLNSIAKGKKKKAEILIRVTPGIKPKTHSYISTGQVDSKFGLGLETGEALRVIKLSLVLSNIEVCGLHCHVGSQVLHLESFDKTAELMIGFLAKFKKETGKELAQLNMGGGLGIHYTRADEPPPVSEYVRVLSESVMKHCVEHGLSLPEMIIEPGRSIIGEAGTTLYEVGTVKTIPGIRTYVSVDGGMTDNPRPALYQAKYEAAMANRMNDEHDTLVSVAGKCCETGDMLLWDVKLPCPKRGDILSVFSTGAYNYSMASHYNRLPKPAMVLVNNGRARLIVKRETYEDVARMDIKI